MSSSVPLHLYQCPSKSGEHGADTTLFRHDSRKRQIQSVQWEKKMCTTKDILVLMISFRAVT